MPHALEAGNEGVVVRFLDVPLSSFVFILHQSVQLCFAMFCLLCSDVLRIFSTAWRHHSDFLDLAGLTELEQYEDGSRWPEDLFSVSYKRSRFVKIDQDSWSVNFRSLEPMVKIAEMKGCYLTCRPCWFVSLASAKMSSSVSQVFSVAGCGRSWTLESAVDSR